MCRAASSIPTAQGALAAADANDMESPETYLGYGRGQNFASGPPTPDKPATLPDALSAGSQSMGPCRDAGPSARKNPCGAAAGGKITFFFHARDLHLVLGPAAGNKPVRFKVTLDGQPPGAAHGADTDEAGNGTVTGQRLYQLIRQQGPIANHTFTIEFLDPGVEAYSFTFG